MLKILGLTAVTTGIFCLTPDPKHVIVEETVQQKEFKLPKLPYAYTALEPYIDAQTMKLHHSKHHQKYVDDLNAALTFYPDLRAKSIEHLMKNLDSVPAVIRTQVRNFGGGHYNHSLFWTVMTPHHGGVEPIGTFKVLIEKYFKSFANFKAQFSTAAAGLFGSGYAWLVADKNGKLSIMTTPNQDTPLSKGYTPLLLLDVWEHAYYLKYHNLRPKFIDAWWHVVNWKQVEDYYNDAQLSKKVIKK